MVRTYRFCELMDRLMSDKVTVVQDDVGQFIFIPVQYLGRRLRACATATWGACPAPVSQLMEKE